ncbi:hypothetical protein [Streptomyces massasporeus]|uniref:hypothetical protein n=1 Tax=Streptomyces massasporeus TaxID=67324 RepID=UPI0036AAC464
MSHMRETDLVASRAQGAARSPQPAARSPQPAARSERLPAVPAIEPKRSFFGQATDAAAQSSRYDDEGAPDPV